MRLLIARHGGSFCRPEPKFDLSVWVCVEISELSAPRC
jgi:hypothetical protein